ncbi:MAG: hypothetical protein HZB59_04380 [Ignavibacteriales bacterium]|nr:hypothetical protein [Ignavibacteriales bacterium]
MENPTEIKLSKFQKLFAVLPPTIFIVSNIFLFTPFTIYQGNLDEFTVAFVSLIKFYLFPSLITILILGGIGILLLEKWHKRYVAILFILGILLWLQSNILRWDYGVLGKADIDWSKAIWRGWIDLTIWIGLLVLTFIFYKNVYKISKTASIAFISLQVVLLCYTSFEQPNTWQRGIEYTQPPEKIFQFSSNQNVIHIILDELQTDVFQNIINQDTGYYPKVFEGFTFFKENMGVFPTTVMSMPALLSGEVYRNYIPIEDFKDSIYKGKTIPTALLKNGYDVDLTSTLGWYSSMQHTNWYQIPVPYGVTITDYEQTNTTYLMNLVLFRATPHFGKKIIFENRINLKTSDEEKIQSFEALRHLSNKAFLQDMIDQMTINRNAPIYKFIHLTTTHFPMIMNSNCEYDGTVLPFTWDNIKIQARCSLDHFIKFLEKLKTIGIYDSSLIIIQADHGYWKVANSITQLDLLNLDKSLTKDFTTEEDFAEKVCASSPLLLIKLPNARGKIKTSYLQTQTTDIPTTLCSLLKINEIFNGQSIFEIDKNKIRDRRFYYYNELNGSADKYFDNIYEYSVRGNINDRVSWRCIKNHLPGESYSTSKIIFGTDASRRYLRYGWSINEKNQVDGTTFSWSVGDSASLHLTLPKNKILLTMNVNSPFIDSMQLVTVKLDGKVIGGWRNLKQGQWENHYLSVNADNYRPYLSEIEFHFSHYLKPSKKDNRKLALLFQSLSVAEVK